MPWLRRRADRVIGFEEMADDADPQALDALAQLGGEVWHGTLALAGSVGSWPAMACSSRAQSSTVQAIGPV